MENASKALLIAGAILIVLIIIGISIAFIAKTEIFTQIFSNSLSEEEIANHNAIFNIYDGQISGAQVNTLVATAEANNSKSDIKIRINLGLIGLGQYIISDGDIAPADLAKVKSAGEIISLVDKNKIYNAVIGYDGKGIIKVIRITG